MTKICNHCNDESILFLHVANKVSDQWVLTVKVILESTASDQVHEGSLNISLPELGIASLEKVQLPAGEVVKQFDFNRVG